MPSKNTQIGVKHDRFRSKLPIACKHRWQPFGVPLNANGFTRNTLRCSRCGLTRTEKKAVS